MDCSGSSRSVRVRARVLAAGLDGDFDRQSGCARDDCSARGASGHAKGLFDKARVDPDDGRGNDSARVRERFTALILTGADILRSVVRDQVDECERLLNHTAVRLDCEIRARAFHSARGEITCALSRGRSCSPL